MFKLNETVASTVAKSITSVEKSEMSQTEVFLLVTEQYKMCKNDTQREDLTKSLKEVVNKKTKFSSTKSTYTRIFNLSSKYTEMFVIVKSDLLHYTTLSKLVKLMYYVYTSEEWSTNDYKTIQSKVASVYKEGMGTYSYNNLIDALIKELKQVYKAIEIEGEFKFQDVFDIVKASVSKLSDDERAELVQMLLNDTEKVA